MPLPDFREDGWLPEGHHETTWEEVAYLFGGSPGSRRELLIRKLFLLRDKLRQHGVTGYFILDGSFISAKPEPKDFDVLLVAPPDIQALKQRSAELDRLLDAEDAEKERGYSLLFAPSNSVVLPLLRTAWDCIKYTTTPKGVVEVEI